MQGNPLKYVDPTGMAMDCSGGPRPSGAGDQGTSLNCTETIAIREKAPPTPAPTKGPSLAEVLTKLRFQPGGLDVSTAKKFYESNFARYAAESSTGLAFLNFAANELFVPKSDSELTFSLAIALVPGPLDESAFAAFKGRRIAGFTRHGLNERTNQAISRDGVGVSSRAMLDAVTNPLKVVPKSNGTAAFIGRDATVVLNGSDLVVTTWARGQAGWRTLP